jgi:hypothetical protein
VASCGNQGHPRSGVHAGQPGGRVRLGQPLQQPSGPAANVQDGARLGYGLVGHGDHVRVHRAEEGALQPASVVSLRPCVKAGDVALVLVLAAGHALAIVGLKPTAGPLASERRPLAPAASLTAERAGLDGTPL